MENLPFGVHKEREKFDRQVAEIKENNTILQTKCAERQKQIILLCTENTSLNSELKKLKEKTAKQETRQRLVLLKLDKVQHSVKVALCSSKVTEFPLKKTEINPPIQNLFQQLKPIKIVPEISVKEPCTYIYVDGNNLRYACELLGIELDFNSLRIKLTQDAAKTKFKYYFGVQV
ncbi:MAG: hypothetical protein IGR93_08335 [Hydrococcus sp. C42_A2020_068]|uniref:hypothetical protein n=1 Tax=Pleurocapsa sp. PCC 7327 TaxID=118163 RepID=UPI00029FDBA7|nr:hypothetical protein [Pleurocapsa sp. PCC 7327]AFY79408.1 hypothetical protein Ple7327_4293 [Pleurocapsa sp. PCC 7327]MBF2020095.1 hypothetical protein [Hydrococcus sp. C42_A2020_068]